MIPKKQVLTKDREEYIRPIVSGLPVAFYTTHFTKETYNYVSWHWHEAFQYVLVTEGNVAFQTPNNRIVLKEGEGIFLNYKQPHLIEMADDAPSAYICLELPTEVIENDSNGLLYQKYVSPFLEHDSIQIFVFRDDTEHSRAIIASIEEISRIVFHALENPGLKIRAEIYRIWDHTVSQLRIADHSEWGMDYNVNHRLRKILRYISRNYPYKLTLDDVAKQVNLSRSECSRFFHRSTGQSLFAYLSDYRITRSLPLLEEDVLSIADIAAMVGFSSQSYYTKVFKEKKNMTPNDYRKLCIGQATAFTQAAEL